MPTTLARLAAAVLSAEKDRETLGRVIANIDALQVFQMADQEPSGMQMI